MVFRFRNTLSLFTKEAAATVMSFTLFQNSRTSLDTPFWLPERRCLAVSLTYLRLFDSWPHNGATFFVCTTFLTVKQNQLVGYTGKLSNEPPTSIPLLGWIVFLWVSAFPSGA